MADIEEKLLAMSEEGAVLVRAGRVAYANAAARDALGEDCVGRRVEALFGELVSGVQASAFLAQIQLGQRPYVLRISRLEKEQIFFLHPQEELPAVLNQPFLYALRSALMNLGLAAEQIRTRAEQNGDQALLEQLRTVTRSQYQILRLLNNASLVLDLSQGEQPLSARVFDLSALCSSILEAAAAVTPQLRFENRCGHGILIKADPRMITTMMMNLLSNAMHHAKNCSRIAVSLLESERSVVLAVDDDGCGIPPEELPRVFDRYRHGFRIDQMNQGPGLGLTAARLVARLHGGALLLESRPDQGTTLRVSLQRGGPEPLRAPETEPTLEMRDLLIGLADCLPPACFGELYLD